jgi:hypothetical protein
MERIQERYEDSEKYRLGLVNGGMVFLFDHQFEKSVSNKLSLAQYP